LSACWLVAGCLSGFHLLTCCVRFAVAMSEQTEAKRELGSGDIVAGDLLNRRGDVSAPAEDDGSYDNNYISAYLLDSALREI